MKKTIRAFIFLMLGPAVIHIIICFFVFFAFSMDYPSLIPDQEIDETSEVETLANTQDEKNLLQGNLLLKKAMAKSRIWYTMSVFWAGIQYLCVIYPFELSAAILYFDHYFNKQKIQNIGANNNQSTVENKSENKTTPILIFSILSMTIIVVVQAINPMSHVRGYRQAYVHIDNAINIYQVQSIKDDQLLINALNESELSISEAFDDK